MNRSSLEHRRSVSLVVVVACVSLIIWVLLRGLLYTITGAANAGFDNVPRVLALGICFDLATLAFTIAPCLLASALIPNRWRRSRVFVALGWVALWAASATLLFGAVAEITFWQEFSTRFNFIAVDYLVYTHEVIANIRESYPIAWMLTGIAAAALAVVLMLQQFVRLSVAPRTLLQRSTLAALAIVLPVTSVVVTNVDQMHGSGNAYADELSGNGLYSLVAAFRRNELDYDRFYRTLPQVRADEILIGLGMEREGLSAALKLDEVEDPVLQRGPIKRRPRNIVLISVESLSAEFLGAYGNKAGLTPNLDRLASEGLRFTRFFATGTRTVRSLEALSLGIPPVPGQSIVRRPGNEHLATVGELLEHEGYHTSFIYGGYGYFDNMNAYFSGNDYHIVDRSSFPSESVAFANAWGVADETLFANSVALLDKVNAAGQPFFTHIMTTSNHRPFTYPAGRIDIASPGGREGGVKYTDYAIGKFIEEARTRPWFDDTLFIITADHCAGAAGKTRLPMRSYLIPLIMYAPALVSPGLYTRVASQIDVPPTILDLLGTAGDDDQFFGQGLFEDEHLAPRSFVSNYQELGYYKEDVLTVLLPKQRIEAFRVDPVSLESTPIAPQQRLVDEAIAYYQTASRAFRSGKMRSPDY